MENELLPQLDLQKVKQKADEAAMKGALEEVNDFYSGYNSPYRKALKAELEKYPLGFGFDLPEIIATINDSLSKQIDIIANEAIAKTYIPQLKRFLTREKTEINFSDILKDFASHGYPYKKYEDCEVSVEKDENHDWLNVSISHKDESYEFTMHKHRESSKEGKEKYHLLSLPHSFSYEERYGNKNMKVTIQDESTKATLEVPFTRDIIKSEFISFLARLIICDSKITMDCTDFDEDWFESDHCHCD